MYFIIDNFTKGAYHLKEKSGWWPCCKMVRDFPNSTDQPDEIALTIYLSGVSSANCAERPGNGGFIQMVRNYPPFRSEWKKRSTSEGTPQFPNGIPGKLPYHLTSNRNFRDFWPNGKHPRGQVVQSTSSQIQDKTTK